MKEPKIKPGEMLHSIVTESVKDDDSTLLAKIDKAEKIVTSSEMVRNPPSRTTCTF